MSDKLKHRGGGGSRRQSDGISVVQHNVFYAVYATFRGVEVFDYTIDFHTCANLCYIY